MMYQRNMKHIISVLFCFLFLVTIPASIYADSNSVHIEKINGVFHLWNERVDFYIDEGGIQLTNHFEEYWTHNVWCLWAKIGETWHRKCADELSWNWENRSDSDHSFVELNGTTTHKQGNYRFGFQVSYLLSENDTEIQIGLGVKNLGKTVDDLDFGWLTHKIQISGDVQNDVGFILLQNKTCQEILDCPSCNYTDHCLPIPKSILLNRSDIDYSFTEEDVWLRGCNESCGHHGRYGYTIYDNRTTSHFLFDWCGCAIKNGVLHNSTFHLFVRSIESEYNAPNLLRIHGSKLEKDDWVFTKFWFSDPDYTRNCQSGGTCSCHYGAGHCNVGVDKDCVKTDTCTYSCPDPLPNSSLVGNTCDPSWSGCDCWWNGFIGQWWCKGSCTCVVSGLCNYECDEGYVWNGSACVLEGEWHIVEIWYGQLITRQWREIENWYGNLTVRAWNEIETWCGKILSRSWKVNQALYGFLERYPPIPILAIAIFLSIGVGVVLFWRRSSERF